MLIQQETQIKTGKIIFVQYHNAEALPTHISHLQGSRLSYLRGIYFSLIKYSWHCSELKEYNICKRKTDIDRYRYIARLLHFKRQSKRCNINI